MTNIRWSAKETAHMVSLVKGLIESRSLGYSPTLAALIAAANERMPWGRRKTPEALARDVRVLNAVRTALHLTRYNADKPLVNAPQLIASLAAKAGEVSIPEGPAEFIEPPSDPLVAALTPLVAKFLAEALRDPVVLASLPPVELESDKSYVHILRSMRPIHLAPDHKPVEESTPHADTPAPAQAAQEPTEPLQQATAPAHVPFVRTPPKPRPPIVLVVGLSASQERKMDAAVGDGLRLKFWRSGQHNLINKAQSADKVLLVGSSLRSTLTTPLRGNGITYTVVEGGASQMVLFLKKMSMAKA